MNAQYNKKEFYRAHLTRDIRFDGKFFVAVKTTKIYCRPICPAIKGIGPWTAEYIAMRGLRDPDAFPATDLEIQKRIKQFRLDPRKWVPWRAYAAILLFSLSSTGTEI